MKKNAQNFIYLGQVVTFCETWKIKRKGESVTQILAIVKYETRDGTIAVYIWD